MLSLLLMLSVGQTTIIPPITSPPFGFEAPLEPIRVEGVPAIAVVGSQVTSVWLDRRRGLDQLDAGFDVWAGRLSSGAEAFSAVLLTPSPRACSSVGLGPGDSGFLATWACIEPDAGLIEQVELFRREQAFRPVALQAQNTGAAQGAAQRQVEGFGARQGGGAAARPLAMGGRRGWIGRHRGCRVSGLSTDRSASARGAERRSAALDERYGGIAIVPADRLAAAVGGEKIGRFRL